MTRPVVSFASISLAVVAVLAVAGCSEVSAGTDAQADTCSSIAPYGGVGKLQTASDIAAAAEAGDTSQQLQEKAHDSAGKLDEVIATSHRAVRADLEDVAALPRAVAQGTAVEALPLEQFREGVEAVRETCFPDKQIQAYEAPTQAPTSAEKEDDHDVEGWAPAADGTLITSSTHVALECGSIKDTGYFDTERSGTEVESYGSAWALISDGETSCASREKGPGVDFIWADEEAGKLRPEFQKIADQHFSDLPEEVTGTPAENVQRAAIECYQYDPDLDEADPWEALTGTDKQGATVHGASLEMCPNHPQVDSWQIQVDNLTRETATEAEEAEHRKAVRDGLYAEDGGHYLIGSELKPGLYRTVGTKVTDCYWETADAQGNIIENSLVSTAPQFELRIPDTAAAFTIRGCEMERIGD